MTALQFQKDLADEIAIILKDVVTDTPGEKRHVGVNVYRQNLPKVVNDDEDETKFFPYAIIRLQDGTTPDDFTPWLVTVNILLGIYDEDEEMGGNDHIMVMIERIIDRFSQEALLARKYRAESEMNWAVQDEDTYPYYFGGVQMKFNIPKPGRKEPDYV